MGHAVMTNTPLYDWLQSRARDIFNANPSGSGDVATVLASVSKYTTDSTLVSGRGGQAAAIYAAQTQIQINPYYTSLRVNSSDPAVLTCGNSQADQFNVVLLHEARHAYQNTIVFLPFDGTSNDLDQDRLPLNPAKVAPTEIIQDTTAARPVCNVGTSPFSVQSRSYQGDGSFDYFDAPVLPFTYPSLGFVRYAIEMDAYTFAGTHQ
jgi:hypothetical protein